MATRAEKRAALKEKMLKLKEMDRQLALADKKAEERLIRDRQMTVGKLAYDAGITGWDDGTLLQLFTILRRLHNTLDPVAVLYGLLQDIPCDDTDTLELLGDISPPINAAVQANGYR